MGNGVMVSARNPAGDHYIGHSGSSGAVALIDQKNNTVGFLTTNVIGPKKDPVSDLAHLMTAVAF